MTFSLPLNFKNDVNELGKLIDDLESTVDELKKDEYWRKSLVVSCRILKEINIEKLRVRITEVLAEAQEYHSHWFELIVEDELHFGGFIERVESGIISGAGINNSMRNRILSEIRSIREEAVKKHSEVTPNTIITGIEALRRDVCQAKDQVIETAKRSAYHTKIVKTLCAIAILVNAVGNVFFPTSSPGALAASVVVGGIKLIRE
jgi:translation elongation factor EF-G